MHQHTATTSPTGAIRYPAAVFLSSGLLFLIEPIAAKRLLPLLGGGAAVWTACLVFFQCALLAGYLLAHWLVTRVTVARQLIIYSALLALSVMQLAIAIDPALTVSPEHPTSSVVWLLFRLIGLPFITLSATSPLLQAWFTRESGGAAVYRLYAVSNVGSLLTLICYPLAIEPRMSLREQSLLLAIAFVLFVVVCAMIARAVRRAGDVEAVVPGTGTARASIGTWNAALWIALAACASLLLSATTTHISQNIATIPLLWIAPLVAYLLSFVVAFSGEEVLPREVAVALGAVGLAVAGYLLAKGILGMRLLVTASGFCIALFLICLFLHAELYRRKPPTERLTTFYFCLAIGGALGAILVGIVAPKVLNGNYELAIGLTLATALGAITTWDFGTLPRIIALVGTAGMANIIVSQVRADRVNSLFRVRNFYGTLHVTQIRDDRLKAVARTLYNGSISHGREAFREDLVHAATSYYGHASGVGRAIDYCCEGRARRIGVIGLGAGTLASYGKPGDIIRFYDINPAVETVARNLFHYVRGSSAKVDIVIGDARVSMATEPPQRYDLIAVDAFSSDAIPVHLITREALEVYKRQLAPGGIIAFHVSNRYLNLRPVVAQLAQRAGMKTAYISNDDDRTIDVWSSDWVLVTANEQFLERPEIERVSQPIAVPKSLRLWTDDYNSLLPIFKFRR